MLSGDWQDGSILIQTPCLPKHVSFYYLLENKVELRLCLLHLVSLQETQVGSPKKMLGVIHYNLVGSGVEQSSLHKEGESGERERGGEEESYFQVHLEKSDIVSHETKLILQYKDATAKMIKKKHSLVSRLGYVSLVSACNKN